jgi:hypothetical protein
MQATMCLAEGEPVCEAQHQVPARSPAACKHTRSSEFYAALEAAAAAGGDLGFCAN